MGETSELVGKTVNAKLPTNARKGSGKGKSTGWIAGLIQTHWVDWRPVERVDGGRAPGTSSWNCKPAKTQLSPPSTGQDQIHSRSRTNTEARTRLRQETRVAGQNIIWRTLRVVIVET